MHRGLVVGACVATLSLALTSGVQSAGAAKAWMNPKLSPDARADLVLKELTFDEQIGLLHGHFPTLMGPKKPAHIQQSAGWVPGVPRLGIPDLTESDASLGVASAGRKDDDATPLPSGVALAATWDARTAFESGAMIGKQARQKGFNVLLNGGVNLLRVHVHSENRHGACHRQWIALEYKAVPAGCISLLLVGSFHQTSPRCNWTCLDPSWDTCAIGTILVGLISSPIL